jgi:hypothetical protein
VSALGERGSHPACAAACVENRRARGN